jgi:hypothetical protein
MEQDYIISLVVGDGSGDGHNRRNYEYYTCNICSLDLEKAYKKGSKICNLDITKKCSQVKFSCLEKLRIYRIPKINEFLDEHKSEVWQGNLSLCSEDFAFIYLSIAWIGNNTLEYKPLNSSYIYIGGYGVV